MSIREDTCIQRSRPQRAAREARWFRSASALRATLKKPAGFEDWFYTGPTLHFGHAPPRKGRGAKK